MKVDKYFEGTKIKAYSGKAPKEATEDYCWGGCPGVMEEVIEVLPRVMHRYPYHDWSTL